MEAERLKENLLCALLVGKAESRDKAVQTAERYQNCPYICLMATKDNQLSAVSALPEKQKEWIEYIEKKPEETLGLEEAKVTIADEVYHSDMLQIHLPEKRQKISPCASNCETCPTYKRCLGCLATVFYKRIKGPARNTNQRQQQSRKSISR